MKLEEKLLKIQSELKCNKSQFNKFGGYKFRSNEDILEAVKPLAHKYKCVILQSDELQNIGERYYIKATTSIVDVETGEMICNTAYAREEDSKKGMDGSQITGTASSYARKYSANGLFAIDDTKDADTNEFTAKTTITPATQKKLDQVKELVGEDKIKAMLTYYKLDKLEDMSKEVADEIIERKTKNIK